MIKKLIKLADCLDINGFDKEANIIDGIIKTLASEDLSPEEIEDMNKLMRGWDTDKEYEFPRVSDSTSPYPPSRFTGDNLAMADIWYTYNRYTLDERDKSIEAPDTIESMFDLSERSNLCALVAFPESVDLLLEFDGNFAMSSESHKDGKYDSDISEIHNNISRADIVKYGLLVTNKQFAAYASEHGFNWQPSRP